MKISITPPWSIVGANIILILFMFWVPWQTQDGPNHKLVATYLAQHQDHGQITETYQTHLGPMTTNQIFPRVYTWVQGHLTVDQYEKIFIFTALSLILWTYFLFLKIYAPPSENYWVIALPILFHLLFIQGMYNFTLSVGLTLMALIFLEWGLTKKGLGATFGFLASCWLAFLAHPFPFFIIGLVLFFKTLFFGSKGRLKTLPYWVITSFFFLWGFILPLFKTTATQATEPFSYKLPWETLAHLFIKNFPGYSPWQLLGFIPFTLLLIYLAVQSWKQVSWRLKIFWVSMLVLFFIFPNAGKGGAHLNIRFLIFLWLFIPLGIKWSGRYTKWVSWLSVLTAIYAGGTVAVAMTQSQERAILIQQAYRSLPDGAGVFPINFDIYGPGLNYTAWMHLWAQFPNDRTFFTPYLFAQSNLMPLSYRNAEIQKQYSAPLESLANEILNGEHCLRPMTPSDCESLRLKTWAQILDQSQAYDFLWLHEPPKDFMQILSTQPQFTAIYSQGPISLWKIAPKHRPAPQMD